MPKYAKEFEVARVAIGKVGQLQDSNDVIHRVTSWCHRLSDLASAEPWRELTTLVAGISGSDQGLCCHLYLVPSPQAHLFTRHQTLSSLQLAKSMQSERDQWIDFLRAMASHLDELRVVSAITATLPFQTDRELHTTTNAGFDSKLIDALDRLHGLPDRVDVPSDMSGLQLSLKGFDFRQWSNVVKVTGLPSRERYGASVRLTQPTPIQSVESGKLQIHYSEVPLPVQEELDTAIRQRSKITLCGQIGVSGVRSSKAKFFRPTGENS